MKARAAVTVAVAALVGVLVACGSGGDSTFPGTEGEGSSGNPPPGFNVGDSSTNPTNVGSCKKVTCADQGVFCGPAGDGCGGKIDDCGTCTNPQTCGGGGTASVCGGTAGCVPRTCAQAGVECGFAGDGCGGVIDCNQPPLGCTPPQICGGNGPSKCGGGQVSPDGGNPTLPDGGMCQPRVSCVANECGPVADGCGGILTCPGCPMGTTCGGGGAASMCGAPACVKKTCVEQNANCGYAADGCGGLLDCGGSMANAGCTPPEICGGGGTNRCGMGVDAGVPCVNFCTNQVSCDAGSSTRLVGKVFAPNGTLPLAGALVYVPNGSTAFPYGVPAFTDGVAGGTCQQCSSQVQNALVTKTTEFDGSFTLDNIPAGIDFPVVVELGRWRRLVTIPATNACTARGTTAAPYAIRLPTREAEGNSRDHIPLVAISTGEVDGLECVFRKLGIEDTQFTNPGGTGRIRLYKDNDGPGATIDATTPNASTLYGTQAELDAYDAVIFACPADEYLKGDTDKDRVRAYADKGGRVFATHFNYVWLHDRVPWSGTVAWDVPNARSWNSRRGLVDTTPGKRLLFSQWLGAPGVNALTTTTPPRVTIADPRNNADVPVTAGAEQWITCTTSGTDDCGNSSATPVLHYTFNTPWAAASQNQCGRVIFSDFHVSIGNTSGETFPDHCNNNALTAQEKILAFMLFDLTSCIQPTTPVPAPCQTQTCGQQGVVCGQAGNGCGGFQDCDPCPPGQICQGNQCITPQCNPSSCTAQSAECGIIANGCGGTLQCPPCDGGVCGGAGANKCGSASCTPIDCAAQGIQCGPAGNGCGQQIDCGPCPPGQTCGGGGQYGVCGAPNCTPRTCQSANAQCGFIANGCGGLVDCGVCPPGQTCGGVTPNQCATSGGPN